MGEPKVRRSGGASLSASRGLSVDSVTIKSTTGARVTSLTIFLHTINVPPAVYPKTPPNILSSSCHAHRSTAVDRFLFAGCFQSRDRWERSKASGVPLQPLRGSALSVGIGVLLRRCATGTSRIGCPHTLLTRAVCARGRTVLAPTVEPANDLWLHGRLHFEMRTRLWSMRILRSRARVEDRGRRD